MGRLWLEFRKQVTLSSSSEFLHQEWKKKKFVESTLRKYLIYVLTELLFAGGMQIKSMVYII